jgi:hypothetical protein
MPNLETLPALPEAAFRARCYGDWTDSVFCTLSANRYVACRLPESQRRRALASFTLAILPHWTICDVGDRGAAAYRQPASAPPALSPFAAMALEAVRHLRRWHAYQAESLPPAAPNMPLDGCLCRVCLSRQ